MTTSRLSTKGQLVLPKELRTRHGWTPGTQLDIQDRGDHVVIREAATLPATSIDDLLGCLPYEGPPKSLAEMEAAIARGARGQR